MDDSVRYADRPTDRQPPVPPVASPGPASAGPAMVQAQFGLTGTPFSIAPDPRFLFMSEQHQEALAHLVYGARHGGLVLLTGEVGTGKTTLCRLFIEQLPDDCDVAFIFNPRLSDTDLLATICDEFRIARPPGVAGGKDLIDRINAWLLERHSAGRTALLIVDEAQNLSIDVLEQMRLLTNLETSRAKLLQIVLIGQPELRELLHRPVLRQLAQRITARCHLEPLSRRDTGDYVRHRLGVVGGDAGLFEAAALGRLHRLTGGVPRLINIVCDRALLGAAVEGRRTVGPRIIARAAAEVFGPPPRREPVPARWLARAASVLVVFGLGAATTAALNGSLTEARLAAAWSALTGAQPSAAEPVAVAPPAPPPAGAGVEVVQAPAAAALPAPDAPVNAAVAANPGDAIAADDLAAASDILAALLALSQADGRTGSDAADPYGGDVEGGGVEGGGESGARSGPDPAVREASRQAAFAALFAAWRLPPPPADVAPCDHAAVIGLRCREGSTDLGGLARLNRPAVLALDGTESPYVTVMALDPGNATVSVDGDSEVWPRATLAALWTGGFTLLWQPPAGYVAPVSVGYQGPVTPWLRRSLAWLQGRPEPVPNSARFDSELRRQVIAFQAANGLENDGVVGPMTIMQLSAAVAGAPRLGN